MNRILNQLEWGVDMSIGNNIGDSIWNSIMGTNNSDSQQSTTNDNKQVPLKKLKNMNKMWKEKMKECNNKVRQLKQQLQTMQQQPMMQQSMMQQPMMEPSMMPQYPVMVQGENPMVLRPSNKTQGGKKRKSMKKKTKRKSKKSRKH